MAMFEGAVAATYVGTLAELCQRWNVQAAELLEGSGLRPELLTEPGLCVDWQTMGYLYKRARRLTGEPALSLHLAVQLTPTTHGYLGFALLTSATLRDAFELMVKYIGSRSRGLCMSFRVEGDAAVVVVESTCGLPLSSFFLESSLVSICCALDDLCGSPVPSEVWMTSPEPVYVAGMRELLPCVLRYGMPTSACRFPASFLDVPLNLANSSSLELALAQCERELAAMAPGPLVSRVRAILQESLEQLPNVDRVAARCHLSTRSLKRKLAEQGATFSELLAEVRRDAATALLADPTLTLDDVAHRVGYTEASSFCRAFKGWTGRSPRAV